MRTRSDLLLMGAAAAMLLGCGEKRDEPPTGPNLATTAAPATSCSFNTIKRQVRDEFTVTADANLVLSLVQSMSGYYPGTPSPSNLAATAQATYVGFQILDQIATKGVAEGTPSAGSALTNSVLACMSVGSVSLPVDFTAALSPNGAYSVRGWTGSTTSFKAPDDRPVTSRDLFWVLEVPTCATPPNTTPTCSPDGAPLDPGTGQYSWTTFPAAGLAGAPPRTGITTLTSQASLPDTVKGLFLAYGQAGNGANFVNTGDNLIVGIFDWKTIPTALFTGVVVGECTATSFLQHNPAGQGAEILGYVFPFCPTQHLGSRESAPKSLVEWAWRVLAPKPAYAALVLGGGSGSKAGSLSPWGVVNPVSVNLAFNQQIPKSGLSVGSLLRDKSGDTLRVAAFSVGGTPIKQGTVFAWIEAINNNGSFVQVCNNWAYTNDQGIAKFPNAYLNKAGGYTLIFKTIGADFSQSSAPGTPQTPAGSPATSSLFNVKNGTVPTDNGCSTGTPDPVTGNPTPINSFIYNAGAGPNGQTLPPPGKYPPPYTLP